MWREVRGAGQNGRGREARTAEMESAELAAAAEAERKTLALPAILSPVQFPGRHLPKPTPVNLRRFAETPVVRRAINVIKDRIAAMDWQVRVRRGFEAGDVGYVERKLSGLMGDGNGGRLADLERRMDRHEQNWQRAKGFLAAVSVLFAVIEVAVEAWHRH